MKKNFDAAGWVEAIMTAIRARNVTLQMVGHMTGVSPSTLSRMQGGRHPDAASLAALSAWAGINPADYCPKVPQPIFCPHCHGTGRMMPNGSAIAGVPETPRADVSPSHAVGPAEEKGQP